MFNNLCSHVTIVEKQKHLMAPMDDVMSAELEKELQSGDPFTAERGRQLVKALRLREAALGSAAYRQGMQDAARLSRRLDELLGAERK